MAKKRYEVAETMATHLAISPATIHMESFEMLNDAINESYDIVDPNNPLVQSGEIAATAVYAFMMRTENALRKTNPKLAASVADLYPHMSDDDFSGIYGSPVTNHIISLALSVKEIKQYAVFNSNTGLYQIVIPRDAIFSANGLYFTAHQPIVIKVWNDGNITANFDSNIKSPILQRLTNVFKTRRGRYDGVEYFIMDIPCDQLNIISYSEPVSASRKWAIELDMEDTFYYARGYYSPDNSTWVEMHMTFDGNTYDPINPTMVIEVDDQVVKAYIPDIFITQGAIGLKARVDVYTTKGKATINLSDTTSANWTATWNDFSGLSDGYISPLEKITSKMIFSTDVSTGGMAAKTFNELKNAVIYHQLGKRGAYLLKELEEQLASDGYTFSIRKDNLTDRVYVASRSLDEILPLEETGLSTGIGVSNEPVNIYTGRTDLTYGVKVNENRCCIKPAMLYKENSGIFSPLSDNDYAALTALDAELMVAELNSSNYAYTPLHTILDYSTPVYTARSYWLNEPEVLYHNIIKQNSVLGYTVSTTSNEFSLDDETYKLRLVIEQPTGITDLFAQITFKDLDENLVYLNASGLVNGNSEITFDFDLVTAFDIDADDTIDVVALNQAHEEVVVRCKLEQEMNVIFIASSTVTHTSSFDSLAVLDIYTDNVTALTHETHQILFGRQLKRLHVMPATLIKSPEYKKYLADVPAVYESTKYKTDAAGRLLYTVETDGTITLVPEYLAGDQVMVNGQPVFLHREGDDVLNPNTGLPIEVDSADYLREIRMPLFDARFLFSTNSDIITYREGIPAAIYEMLSDDIDVILASMIERTRLYFEPRSTRQSTKVKVSTTRTISLRTALTFNVVFLTTEAGYEDFSFREQMEQSAKDIIVKALSENKFSISGITSKLDSVGQDKILNVMVSDPTGGTGLAEIIDTHSTFSIAKTLEVKPNGEITLVDNINFVWSK